MIDTKVFSMAPFYLCHYYLTGLHPWAADICCAIAGVYKSGLDSLKVLHIGAGFGGDLWASVRTGAEDSIGIDIESEQVKLFHLLQAFPTTQPHTLLRENPVTRVLYKPEDLVRVSELVETDFLFTPMNSGSAMPVMVSGDVLDLGTTYRKFNGRKSDVLVLNVSLHWLVKQAGSVAEVFSKLGELVDPGGILVASLPLHLLQTEVGGGSPVNESAREKCLYRSPAYNAFSAALRDQLKTDFPEIDLPTIDFDPVPGMAVEASALCFG